MNIFLDCSLTHIKIRNSELYITRLHISYFVNGQYSSNVQHLESDSPHENSLKALDLFNIEFCKFVKMHPNESFSSIKIERSKYRGFQVFTSLKVNNLIKVNKTV